MNFEQILALLQAAFAGARKDALTQMARVIALQAQDEEQAKAIVNKLTDAQINEFTKSYRSDVDKEVADGTKTFETNLKKKYDLVEKGGNGGKPGATIDPNPTGGTGENIQETIKAAIAEAVKPLQEKLAAYDTKSLAETRLAGVQSLLDGCKDDAFKQITLRNYARMAFNDDAAHAEYLEELKKDIETANQNFADAALQQGGGSPLFAHKDNNGISQGVADYIASKTPDGDSNLGGKKL